MLLKNIFYKFLLLAFVLIALCSRSFARNTASNPLLLKLQAENYTANGQIDSALAYWKLLNAVQANNDTIFYAESQLYYAQHHLDSASYFIQNAVALRPENIAYLELQAIIDYRLNKTDSALLISDKILNAAPQNVNALLLSGIILRDEKKDTEALDRFDRCVKADPSNTEALVHRADEYVLIKKYNDALRDYSSARADLSENADILNNIGICYYQSGAYLKAIDFFKKALNINQSLPQSYFNKGLSDLHLNHLDTASVDLKIAGAIWDTCHADSCRSNYMDAMYYLGLCYKKTGNLTTARAYFTLLQKEKYSKDLSADIKLIDYSLFISQNWYYFILLFALAIILFAFLAKLIRR